MTEPVPADRERQENERLRILAGAAIAADLLLKTDRLMEARQLLDRAVKENTSTVPTPDGPLDHVEELTYALLRLRAERDAAVNRLARDTGTPFADLLRSICTEAERMAFHGPL